jgi:hypothetical protein
MSITNQIIVLLPYLTCAYVFPLYKQATLLLPKKMLLFQEVLIAMAFARALLSYSVSPVLFSNWGDYSSAFPIAFYASLRVSLQWRLAISIKP